MWSCCGSLRSQSRGRTQSRRARRRSAGARHCQRCGRLLGPAELALPGAHRISQALGLVQPGCRPFPVIVAGRATAALRAARQTGGPWRRRIAPQAPQQPATTDKTLNSRSASAQVGGRRRNSNGRHTSLRIDCAKYPLTLAPIVCIGRGSGGHDQEPAQARGRARLSFNALNAPSCYQARPQSPQLAWYREAVM